jgi:hypothetical protein
VLALMVEIAGNPKTAATALVSGVCGLTPQSFLGGIDALGQHPNLSAVSVRLSPQLRQWWYHL